MVIKVYNKVYEFKDDCPEEVLYYYRNRIKKIPKEIYYKYDGFWVPSKKIVFGYCDVSGKYTESQMKKLINRKYLKNKLIHPSVLLKEICKIEEWREINSKAQLIAQNKPGQRKINSQALKKVWSDDSISERWRDSIVRHNKSEERRKKIGKASKALWADDSYRKMMLDKFKGYQGVSGIFHSKFSEDIRFESTYELFYAFHQDLKKQNVKRFIGEIKYYLDGEKKGYRPDFIVDNNIIEIKSSWILDNYQALNEMNAKRDAAEKLIKSHIGYNDFFLLQERDLDLMGDFKIKNHIIWLLKEEEHISIHHGKIQEFKNLNTDNIKKAKELINKWNLLK